MTGDRQPSGGGAKDNVAATVALAMLAAAAAAVAAQTGGAIKDCAIAIAFVLIGWAVLLMWRR